MEFPQRFRYGFAPEKGKKADLMFVAMEYLDGLTLKHRIGNRGSGGN